MPDGGNVPADVVLRTLEEIRESIVIMNIFVEETKDLVTSQNSAIDELDQRIGAMRQDQRRANQLVGTAERAVEATTSMLKKAEEQIVSMNG